MHMDRRIILGLAWLAWLAWPGAAAPAQLIPGGSNSLPRLVTRRGETFALGKKPYPAGTRAQWIAEGRARARAPADSRQPRKALKGAADNRALLPPIRSQGSEGSCVHWAGAYYVKTASMKQREPGLNVSVSSNQCSPRFTYNLTNEGADNGGYGHEPFEIFMRYGGASLLQKPYVAGQYATLPTVADFTEGLHRRTTGYVWAWDWNPDAAQIAELKAWLDAGGVAACAIYAEDTFDAWGPGDPPWYGTECASYDMNHMVTVCGYGPGTYLVANSWGTSFGSNGFIVVDAGYFENYVGDVMYPLEGTYEPATSRAELQIQHGRRSDIRSLAFTVNGAVAWSNAPTPRSAPLGTGWYETDARDDWALAVDLSAAPWGAANAVTARCLDRVTGTAGTLVHFTLFHGGQSQAATNLPVAIPDNSGAAATAAIQLAPAAILGLHPPRTNVPAAASGGRTLAVTGTVAWTAAATASWLRITSGGSGTNDGAVAYDVAANVGTAARTGTIVVAGGGLARTGEVAQAGAAPAAGNVIAGVAAPGQVGATMANLIYGGHLSTPVHVFHVPYGTSLASLAPALTLAPGATASPASGTARNFTAPRVAYVVTYAGQPRTNYVHAVALAPAAATNGHRFDAGVPALRDIWVDPVNGSDTAGNGSARGRAYRTIDRAWADVPAQTRFATTGYRLMLCAGTYADDRSWMEHRYGTYDFPLVLEAADGPGTAVIAYDMQFFSCDFVYLRGLVFEPANGGDGLHLDSCEYVLIRDCAIRGGPGTQRLGREGLKANQCEYLYVEDSEIANAYGNALDYMCCHYGHIRGCRIHDADDWTAYVKGGSSDFLIEGNEFYNGGTGGFTAGQGAGSEFLTAPWIHHQASNIRFVNNVVRDCDGAGFGVNGGRNILFAYNTLYRVGARSHGIEVTFGNNSLDGAAEAPIAQTYLEWGGWTHTSTSGDQRIPNQNVYIYNNILYNPPPYQSEWQHFEFTGPWDGNTNPHIPRPATTDGNLQIKGNVLWNGPPDLELGIWEDTACQPDNPTCNAGLLVAQNHINQFAPQLADPAHGDFRPVAGGNVFSAQVHSIPPFPEDRPLAPPEPEGGLNNPLLPDRDGIVRDSGSPPGAYAGAGGLWVVPAVRQVDSGAGSTTFSVTNTGGGSLAYVASETSPWLAILSGGTGTNGGVLVVSHAANASAMGRTGAVIVAGGGTSRTCLVTQAAFRQAYPSGTPWGLPGTVEAENFDRGGAGVAYGDATAANEGGQYRTDEGVDIAAQAQAGNGFTVGWTPANEWLEYTVNLAASGTYTLEARVAGVGAGGRFRIWVNGVDQAGLLAVPHTGAWNAYQTVQKPGVALSSGIQTVRVEMVTAGPSGNVGAFDWFRVVAETPVVQSAYPAGTPWALPGTVEAENFDNGGAGVAYGDATPANEGGQYRTGEGVDIANDAGAGNGRVVGWTPANEWLEYTVNLAVSGTYTLEARVAGVGVGGRFRIWVNGVDQTGLLAVPNTGAWNAYQVVQKTGVALSSGIQTVRVEMATAGPSGHVGAFDWFRVVAETPVVQSAYPAGTPWGLPGTVEAENFDRGGAGVAYGDATTANEGGQYRMDEGVDIAAQAQAGNGFTVGWTPANEWLEYTVNLAASGTYTLEARVAGVGAGGQFRIRINGVDQTGLLAVPNTGAWNAYQVVQKTGVALSSGIQTVRVEMATAGPSGHVGAFDLFRVYSGAAGKSAPPRAAGFNALIPLEVRTSDEAFQPAAGWLAADEDPETAWRGLPGANGWWLAMAYEPPIPIRALALDWAPGSPTNVQCLLSLDAEAWTELVWPLTNGPVPARYLWLVFPAAGADLNPAIRELKIE